MHRSGTSAVARVCNLLGVELGLWLLAPQTDNEEGFWEHEIVCHAHEELLAAIGSAWDDVRTFPEDWLNDAAVNVCRDKIIETLCREFSDSPIWAVKDPRICRLVPLWLSVLRELGCKPHFLLIGRNPLEVAGSLASRNSFPANKSQLLWLRHLIDAERDTRGYPRAFITYEALLRDWRRTMSRVSRKLGLEWPRPISSASPEVDQFLRARLRHQKVDDVVLDTDRRVSRWVRDAYRAFKTATDGEEAQLRRTLRTIVKELDAAERDGRNEALSGELAAAWAGIAERDRRIEKLSSDLSEREAQLQAIYLSTSWRVTSPMRAVKIAFLRVPYYGRVLLGRTARAVYRRLLLSYQRKQRLKSFVYRNFGFLIKNTAS